MNAPSMTVQHEASALPIEFTIFPDRFAQNARRESGTWGDLVEMLRNPPEHGDKKKCPLIKLATFGDRRSEKGALRHDANVLEVFGIEGDYDAESMSVDKAVTLLASHGIESLVYTSASHGVVTHDDKGRQRSNGGPRWRVLAPLSRPHAPAERDRLVAMLNYALGGILADESFTLSQTYYFGKVKNVEYQCRYVRGDFIDTLDLVLDVIYGTGEKPRTEKLPGAVKSESTDDDLDREIALHSVKGETIEHLRQAIRALKPERANDRHSWINGLEALASLKETLFADDAFGLADEFSRLCPEQYDYDDLVIRWEGMNPTRITYRTIFEWAKADGWINSKSAEGMKLAAAAAFDKILSAIKAAKPDGAEGAVELTNATIPEVAKARLTSVQEELLLKSLKGATGVRLSTLRVELAKLKERGDDDETEAGETHADYAKQLLLRLAADAGDHAPVGVEGHVYTLGADAVWRGRYADEFEVQVGEMFSGQPNCSRRGDYTSIAKHAYAIAALGNGEFFAAAPLGLACPDGTFYRLDAEGTLAVEKLTAAHRQRFVVGTTPADIPTPLFDRFLAQTFASDVPGECEAQIALLQEIMGAAAMGLMAKHEKAVLLYGPGRAGKGTVLKIMEELVPKEWGTAVSPFRWNSEYYVAFLAGKRLNVVGELPEEMPIPAADFKTVTGRDLLTGRDPGGRPFTFRNEAAHIFNSNYLINTRDHSEAFFSRWVVVAFRNSRLAEGDAAIDGDLAKRIIGQELPGILWWALQGALRLLARGHFLMTRSHAETMTKWRLRTDSVLEFLHDTDVCALGPAREGAAPTKRVAVYDSYVRWCMDAGRKPMAKRKVFDMLESPAAVALGLRVRRDAAVREVVDGLILLNDGNDGF